MMGMSRGATVILITAIITTYYLKYNPLEKASIITENLDREYDYIIVGAGAAGSVIASRLSEDGDKKVLLLEAGGHFHENPLVPIPLYWTSLLRTDFDWGYYTEPQTYLHFGFKEKRGYWPRGRVLGGSTTINGVHYTRGSKFDFNEWASNGCEGWSYKDVLPYFLKSEDIQIEELKASIYHSSGGPIAISGGHVTPLTKLYFQAGLEMGYNISDYNGKDQEGFNKIQVMVRNGVRSGIAIEYLGKTAQRNNLHISIRSFVTKVDIKNNRANGVYVVIDGRKRYIKAGKEVIISAGAINSPQLLMLSGVGPKEHLEEFGIEIKANLPVGENLQDHLIALIPSKINATISMTNRVKESLWTKLQYALLGSGPLTTGGSDVQAFLYIDEANRGNRSADIQMVFVSGPLQGSLTNLKDEIASEYLASDQDIEGFVTGVSLTRPRSRGILKLRSVDPFDHPIIDPRYLADQRDVDDFIAGVRLWEKFVETPSMKSLGASLDQFKLSLCSQHEFRSDDYWECFIRHLAKTSFHPCCTCKMGSETDPTAVVDTDLRVKGIKNLRVIDTSIFPSVTSGNTQAPTVMVAEKIADKIRGIDSVTDIRTKCILDEEL